MAVRSGILAGLCIAYGMGIWTQQIFWATDFMVFFRGYSLYPQNTDAALNLAEDLIKMQQYASAAAVLTRSSNQSSRYRNYVLAKLYARVNKPEEARHALETELRAAPDLLQSNAGKTEVAILFAEIGDSGRALYLFGQVLQEEPDLYSAVYNCGYTYFLMKHDSEAEPLLLHAAELMPSLPSPHFYLGQLYFRAGKTGLAETHLRKALSLNPDGYDYHYWLGRALEASGKTEQAQMEFSDELKLHPKTQMQ